MREYRTAANSPAGTIADRDEFSYDAAGRILSATKGRYANVIGYAYDDGGRIASEFLTVGGQTYTIGRGYDDAGHLDELIYPDGTAADRLHDARGLLAAVSYGGSTVASFGYDAGGRETTRTFGNGLVTTTSYVPDDNLLASLATPNVGTYSYSYDANKNRTAEAIAGTMSGYGYDTGPAGYDAEDRLVNWDRADGQLDQSWDLSAVGDWDQFTENQATEARTHNAVHELTGIDAAPLTYDPKGNLTADHLGRSFVWDADNMLASCTVGAGASVGMEGTHGYAYDAIGRRVSKTVDQGGGTFTTTVFSQLTLPIPPLGTPGGQTLAEYAAGAAPASPASPERSYAFGSYVDEPLVIDDGTDTLYYHRDGRYSIVALTDATGAVSERYGYDAYGKRLIADAAGAILVASAVGNDWGFTGRRHEAETRLQYFRARYYAAELGRFVGRDPLKYDDGANLFSPYFIPSGVDPSGRGAISPEHGPSWNPPNTTPKIKGTDHLDTGWNSVANGRVRVQFFYGPWKARPEWVAECKADCKAAGKPYMGAVWVADVKFDYEFYYPYTNIVQAKGGTRAAEVKCCCDCTALSKEKTAEGRKTWESGRKKYREKWEESTGGKWPTNNKGISWAAHHIDDLKHGGHPTAMDNLIPAPPSAHKRINKAYIDCHMVGNAYSGPGVRYPYRD